MHFHRLIKCMRSNQEGTDMCFFLMNNNNLQNEEPYSHNLQNKQKNMKYAQFIDTGCLQLNSNLHF